MASQGERPSLLMNENAWSLAACGVLYLVLEQLLEALDDVRGLPRPYARLQPHVRLADIHLRCQVQQTCIEQGKQAIRFSPCIFFF